MMIICFQREALMLCFFDFSETTRVTVIRKVIMMIAVTGEGGTGIRSQVGAQGGNL